MKVALVHELLTMRGGAERMLRVLADMFPQAPIYTLLYNEKKLGDWFPRERVRVARIPSITVHCPLSTVRFNHHLSLSSFPSVVEAWDFSDYDLVLSSSSAFVHGIITNGRPRHLCYVHSPARYLWDRTHDVLDRASRRPLGFLKKRYLEKRFHVLRTWDAEAAARADMLLAPSREVQRRIELYWRRNAEVLHPPIDDLWLQDLPTPTPLSTDLSLEAPRGAKWEALGAKVETQTPSYVLVSTLVPYKRIDLAIEACNLLKRPLRIVGEGPARRALERMAGPTIQFLGYRDHEELKTLYALSTATIVPGQEDFGLVPLESMACGTPVIALRGGGALETSIEGETGEFFEGQAEALARAIQKLEGKTYDPARLHAHARQFSRERFEKGLRRAIETMGNA